MKKKVPFDTRLTINTLTPYFWNITDFGANCVKWGHKYGNDSNGGQKYWNSSDTNPLLKIAMDLLEPTLSEIPRSRLMDTCYPKLE
jgi:hypothetical protein